MPVNLLNFASLTPSALLSSALGFFLFMISISMHEWGHGFAAYLFGDNTAKDAGRLTLNPIAHVDPLGTVILPLLGWVMGGGFMFGWAKPVPVNPMNFRNLRIGDIVVSLAGVTMNFILMALFFLFFALTRMEVFLYLSMINFGLIYINLLPVPPLDGYHVVLNLLPSRAGNRIRYFVGGREMVFLLIFFMLMRTPLGTLLFMPADGLFRFFARTFLGFFGGISG